MTEMGVVRGERKVMAIIMVACCLGLGLAACGSSGPAKAETTTTVPPTPSVAASAGITSVPIRVIQTTDGRVAYRQLGKGTPLLLIMGHGGSIDDWEPSFVNALASRYRVIVFNNAGVGPTSPLTSPLTVSAMAEQTSAFISALGLERVDVLGWSMGGHDRPGIDCAAPVPGTPAGPGRNPSRNGARTSGPGRRGRRRHEHQPGHRPVGPVPTRTVSGPAEVRDRDLGLPRLLRGTQGPSASQSSSIEAWLSGNDPSGHLIGAIRVPTMVADGTVDTLDPAANARMLTAAIPGTQLVLYPGAGHGFMFQDAASFIPRLEKFLR